MLILANLLALALIAVDDPQPATGPVAGPDPEVWNLTLPEAIRIGLENSEAVRVISLDRRGTSLGDFEPATSKAESHHAPIAIARLNADESAWQFKAALMAHVRSVEQTYWALAQQEVAVWSRKTAVKVTEEILKLEQADLATGRSTTADIAEVEQQLENLKLNLIAATSDRITTERQLRNILGLPAADNRRIVPTTSPTEAKLEPEWEASLATMLSQEPGIAQQAALVRLTELELLMARNQLLPALSLEDLDNFRDLGLSPESNRSGLAAALALEEDRRSHAGLGPNSLQAPEFLNSQVGLGLHFLPSFGSRVMGGKFPYTRQAQYQLLKQHASLKQVVDQSTHTLARFFLEVDSNYKQFQTARKLRDAARQRLEAQRAFYDEGRITVDRLLDAINQYANAISQEAQFKADYNTSIAALEEAKGSLLAYDGINLVEGPSPKKPDVPTQDEQVAPAAFKSPAPAPVQAEPAPSPSSTSTYKLRAKLGGIKMWEIELEINQGPASPR